MLLDDVIASSKSKMPAGPGGMGGMGRNGRMGGMGGMGEWIWVILFNSYQIFARHKNCFIIGIRTF
jgi:hypothetical protein